MELQDWSLGFAATSSIRRLSEEAMSRVLGRGRFGYL